MRRFKKYFLVLLLFIVPNLYAQLNEFMIQWYFNEGNKNNSAAPWQTSNLDFLKCMRTYNFNTVYFETQGINSLNIDFLNDANDANLKSILFSDKLTTSKWWTYNKEDGDAALNAYSSNLIGYNIEDEPSLNNFYKITPIATEIRNYNESLFRWVNFPPSIGVGSDRLYRENYVQNYINQTKPNILSFDDYPIAYGQIEFFKTLYDIGIKSVENSIPFIYVLTPFHNQSGYEVVPPYDISAKSESEFNYVIYAALAYGAKGIAYWPGFQWVRDKDNNIFELSDFSSKEYLKILHGKLQLRSKELLSLNFASAYHVKKAKTIMTHTNVIDDEIHDFCSWDKFKVDPYANRFFDDMTAPIVDFFSGTVPDELAVTFMTTKEGKVYFWLFNKSLTKLFNLHIPSSYYSELRDVLNDQLVELDGTFQPGLLLEPGEAKLFTTTYTPNPLITTIDSYHYVDSDPIIAGEDHLYPFESANQITLSSNVTFAANATKSFMAKNIVLNPGVRIESGSTVRLSAYKDCNTIPPTSPSGAPRKKDDAIEQAPLAEPKIYPNPTRDNFIVKTSLKADEEIEVRVYDNVGRIINVTKALTEETTISLGNQPTGIYFVRFAQHDKTYSYKVVKL